MHHIATELVVGRLTGFGRILWETIGLSVTSTNRVIYLSSGYLVTAGEPSNNIEEGFLNSLLMCESRGGDRGSGTLLKNHKI